MAVYYTRICRDYTTLMLPDNIPVTKVLTNFADSMVVNFLQLEKKCYSMVRAQLEIQEMTRIVRRQRFLEEYRKKIQGRR